jgi:hypothetical protein
MTVEASLVSKVVEASLVSNIQVASLAAPLVTASLVSPYFETTLPVIYDPSIGDFVLVDDSGNPIVGDTGAIETQ